MTDSLVAALAAAQAEPDALRKVAEKWWTPPAEIVAKLPRGGNKDKSTWQTCRVCRGWHAPNAIHLDYVGHSDLTRALIEIDPEWQWEPVAFDEEGLPRVSQRGGMYVLWGRVTLLGKTMLAVGTCETTKLDVDKELVGDMLRNAGMRFGIFGSLWSKVDGWDETTNAPISEGAADKAVSDSTVTVAPEKPVDEMTVAELIAYAREIGVRVSGSKTEMQYTLRPYALAATGAEPFEVTDSSGNVFSPPGDMHLVASPMASGHQGEGDAGAGKESVPGAPSPPPSNPASAVKDSLRNLPPDARKSIRERG